MNRPTKQAGYFVISGWLASALSYVFLITMTRSLPPENFAALQSIFALSMIGMVAGIPFRLTTAKLFASQKLSRNATSNYLKSIKKKIAIPFVALFLLSVFFAHPLSDFLNFKSWITIPLIASVIFFDIYFQILSACLQGTFEWRSLSIVTVMSPLLKLVIATICLKLGQIYLPDMPPEILPAIGLLISIILTNSITRRLIAHYTSSTENIDQVTADIFTKDTLILAGINIAFAVLIQIDSVIGNIVLPTDDKGNFAVLSVLGKMFLYLTTAASPLVFSYRAKGEESSILKPALIIVSALALISIPFAYLAGPWAASVLFGKSYTLVPQMIVLWILLNTVFAVIHILIMEVSAGKLTSRLYFAPALVILTALVSAAYCKTPLEIFLAIASSSIFVALWLGFHLRNVEK